MRMTTDLPAAFMALLGGDIDLGEYLRSMRDCKVEAVFSLASLPGLIEILLVPTWCSKGDFEEKCNFDL